jgi:hypothetical protein
MTILNVWFTDQFVYKTLGNNGLCAVAVVDGVITALWYIPSVTVSVLFGAFLVTVVQGGDSTRYYVTLQATRVRSVSVVSCMLSSAIAHILHNDITIITACYYIYVQNGLFIFSTMIFIHAKSISPVKSISQL